MTRIRSILLLAAAVGLVASCGGAEPAISAAAQFGEGAIGIVASSDLGVGPERLLMGVAGADGARLGSPDDAVEFEVAPLDDLAATTRVPATFTWILEPVIGIYRADFDFTAAGAWQAVVVPENGDPLEPVLFNVFEEPSTPIVGEAAPVAPTPTLEDSVIDEITTDPDPDPRFYSISLEDAIASGLPTVVIFSTPAYCQSAACGPLLEKVKGVAPDYPEVNFIHVEVFTGLTDPDFKPDGAHLAPAVTEEWFRLPSEPWVFVIDGAGTIAARFEGVMDASELNDVLGKISL